MLHTVQEGKRESKLCCSIESVPQSSSGQPRKKVTDGGEEEGDMIWHHKLATHCTTPAMGAMDSALRLLLTELPPRKSLSYPAPSESSACSVTRVSSDILEDADPPSPPSPSSSPPSSRPEKAGGVSLST